MGATNVGCVFSRYAGKVPPLSLVLLAYMALVSKDADDWPFFRMGQPALAELAMGRENPDASDVRAVQRALKPLLDVGAITVDRAGATRGDGNVTARYRLNLHERADKARAEWEGTPDGNRRMSDGRRDPQHTTKSGGDIRRFVTEHTTVSDETYDGNRRPQEEVGDMRSDKTEEEGSFKTASHPPRAHEPADTDNVIPLFPGTANAPEENPYRPIPVAGRRWSTRGMDTIAEAMERQAAKRAAHRASLAAEGTETA